MRVSKELIEQYHAGLCTPEEQLAVEEWLFNDDTDALFALPGGEEKHGVRDAMWNEIAGALPANKSYRYIFFNSFWRQAAAALLVGLAGVLLYSINNKPVTSEIIVINNESNSINKDLHTGNFNLSLAPKSNVEIDRNSGRIDFCGAMMIKSKMDVEFTIQGTCTDEKEHGDKIKLKKGLNYIALNYAGPGEATELLVLEEKSLMGLPPLMKRQLMDRFDI
ncbi:hypothetical protein [Dyadobacter aurulentus]|uniref:hypothetical protein n=1 Tax=Dyadobacter sp. UC 10 TaxID=2605428 RepID=UPI0011F319B1|nr:hypothetical protein [Dyadobacter sp. UC 10]KAA0992852.1 hypothetical protein FXO21_23110 [Dyadobacter sp. UC 10]